MDTPASAQLRRHLVRVLIYVLAVLLLLPGLTLIFVRHAIDELDGYSQLWQFHVMGQAAQWALAGGVAVLLFIVALGAVAFVNRRARYVSFVMGWALLRAACVLAMLAQGVMLVWLSYWVGVFFFQIYVPKLIGLVGVAVAWAAYYAITGIFRRVPLGAVDGEPLKKPDAPALWAHVQELAQKVGTAPPDHIVAGIDTSFFVTEAPLAVGADLLKGRILFISLPLLRILDTAEADGVLAHELAHLRGGDSASSAALGPKLLQYDQYAAMMGGYFTTRPVYYILALYRMIFEFALQRDSREREFMADQVAANIVSPAAISHALIKTTAYTAYRAQIEKQLAEHNKTYGTQLGIAQFVSDGLGDYAKSESFAAEIRQSQTPHPYDTHPLLAERMSHVNCPIAESDYGAIVAQKPAHTWVDDIATAADIEQRLWQKYEGIFSAQHELDLACRYEPASVEEEAIVLKHFPPLVFTLKNGQRIEVNYAGLKLPDGKSLAWEDAGRINLEDVPLRGEHMVIYAAKRKRLFYPKTSIKLKKFAGKEEIEKFKQAVGMYRQRDQMMRAYHEHHE